MRRLKLFSPVKVSSIKYPAGTSSIVGKAPIPIDIGISFTLREGHDCPLAAPCPFPSAGLIATTLCCAYLFILSRLQSHDDISFTRSESKYINSRTRAKRANSFNERCRWIPCSLCTSTIRCLIARKRNRGYTYITSELAIIQVALEYNHLARLQIVK